MLNIWLKYRTDHIEDDSIVYVFIRSKIGFCL